MIKICNVINYFFAITTFYIFQSSVFDSPEFQRLGFATYIKNVSDKFWSKGKSMIKYINQRGGFYVFDKKIDSDIESLFDDVATEVDALAKVYDIVKSMRERTLRVRNDSLQSLDPAVIMQIK